MSDLSVDGRSLHDAYIVIRQDAVPGDLNDRVLYVTGGQGLNDDSVGTAKVFGVLMKSGKRGWVRRDQVERFATFDEVVDADRAGPGLKKAHGQ